MLTTNISFFKRSGTYKLDCFGRAGYKNDVKTAKKKKIWEHMFLCKHLIVYLITSIRISFLLSYLQSVIMFCTLTSKNAIFICFGKTGFLGYNVGKLIFFLRFVFEFYTL